MFCVPSYTIHIYSMFCKCSTLTEAVYKIETSSHNGDRLSQWTGIFYSQPKAYDFSEVL